MGLYKRYYSPAIYKKAKQGSRSTAFAMEVKTSHRGNFWEILEQFDDELKKKALRRGLSKAANVVKKRAKQLAPTPNYELNAWQEETRRLKQNIGMKVRASRGKRSGIVHAMVGPLYPDAAKAHIVEGYPGTKATPRHFAHGQGTGKLLQPQPYMRPAGDETKSEQEKAIKDELLKQLQAAGPKRTAAG